MRRLFAPALLIALAACAVPQQRSRTFQPYAPLQAHITTIGTTRPLFHVNRPAYVAMFYIAPGRGVSMLYPGFGSGSLSGRVFAGSHFAGYRINNGHAYVPMRGFFGGPSYYFLIASDRPLNVEQFGSFGDGLMSRLGSTYASFSAYSTMESLAQLTLPSLANDGSWTTDMYVAWPSVIYSEPGERRVLVRCGSYSMYVRAGYVDAVRSVICDQSADVDPDRPGDDEKKPVVRPKGREPVPADAGDEGGRRPVSPAERQAIRDRIASSSQLTDPSAREVSSTPVDAFGRIDPRARPTYEGGSASRAGRATTNPGAPRPASRGSADAGSSSGRASPSPASRPSSGGPVAAPAPRSSSGGSGSSSPSARPSGRARVD